MRDQLFRMIGRSLLASISVGSALVQGAVAQDFLFKQPSVTLGIRMGYAFPSANSEIFDFTREQLTVDKSDFNAFAFGGELSVRVSNRFDVAASLGVSRSETRSEFRDWVDNDNLPIEQSTRFLRVPLTIGIKAYLADRGRRISSLAWIPSKWAPYVGVGGGYMWYQFEQVGDFVDFETLDIFFDDFESRDGSPMAYLAAGLDYSLGSRWLVTGEARYSWASAGMGTDFVDFDDIDLNGFRAVVGFSVRL